MTSKPLFRNVVILRRPKEANFASIIKIAITLIKINFLNSINLKRITSYVLNGTTEIANFS